METKLCKTCNIEKALEFMVKKEGRYRFQCKDCRNYKARQRSKNDIEFRQKEQERGKQKYQKNKIKHCEITKKYYNENLEWRKDLHLRKTYGISMDDKITMRKLQLNKCKICQRDFENDKMAYVDHCHSTKKVRGLLCHQCNSGIGYMKENIETLERAIKYLSKRRNSL